MLIMLGLSFIIMYLVSAVCKSRYRVGIYKKNFWKQRYKCVSYLVFLFHPNRERYLNRASIKKKQRRVWVSCGHRFSGAVNRRIISPVLWLISYKQKETLENKRRILITRFRRSYTKRQMWITDTNSNRVFRHINWKWPTTKEYVEDIIKNSFIGNITH